MEKIMSLFPDQLLTDPGLRSAVLFGLFGLSMISLAAKMAHRYKWKNKLSKQDYRFTKDLLRIYLVVMAFIVYGADLLKSALARL